ncbi:MAG: TonB-dependent receptor domain-containing protein [Rhodanobacteraceae bacterium]
MFRWLVARLVVTSFAIALGLPICVSAQTASPSQIDIPAGSLVSGLEALGQQTGMQLVYNADQLAGAQTRGAHGRLDARAALDELLAGSGFTAHRDPSGAIVIVRKPPTAQAPPASTQPATSTSSSNAPPSPKTLKQVVVTGSRIPRSQIEGPSPVVTITAQDIQRRGFVDVPDLMTSLNQNLGALENNQYTDGFTPGAQAVDLRGLGPQHTLVLINGRRIANYPQAYDGESNFTDISSIPTAMIERVEILTGSASAIYGSDAMAGVVNFILKKKANGTTINFRVGDTQRGGAGSQRLDITSGFSKGKFDTTFGLELLNKDPLWAYQRTFTDSRLDSPADRSDIIASRNFLRTDVYGDYLDPGKATCDKLAHLDQGTMFYASRDGYAADGGPGHYCGSYADVAYGTLENGTRRANLAASATYHFNDYTDIYLDVLAGTSHIESYNTPLQWSNCEPLNGDCTDTPFYNTATGQIEEWTRDYFTLEENGSFEPGKIRNIGNTLSFNVGVKGSFGSDSDWVYDANFGHSQNKVVEYWPAVIAAKAQELYLGPSLGVDPDSGYQMYYAPVSRLYTPLTVAQFRSITQDSTDHDQSREENWSFTLTNTNLFQLPAGPVGFAAIASYGNSYFGQKTDPLSRNGSYYGLHNTITVGSRDHAAIGYEFSIPVFSKLTLSTAGRYDRYDYGDTTAGKFTYSAGLEYRPFKSLLLRGSLSTGFRAPDLPYLFSGISGSSSGGTDYYQCRALYPDTGPDFYDNCPLGDVSYNGRSRGSTDLKDETSRSFTYGFVFSPSPNFDISADYYRIKLSNEVEFQDSDTILREEADCRLGTSANSNSSFCNQIESQVVRNAPDALFNPNGITSVLVLPINAAIDETSGVDFKTDYRLRTARAGTFDFSFGATYVIMHETQLSPDSPVDDELTDLYYYLIPRTKANASVTWRYHDFTTTLYGSRIGGLPNYDGTKRLSPTYMYNFTMGYRVAPTVNVSLAIDNLFNARRPHDPTWTSYPYYDRAWFNPLGRAYYLSVDMRFGGTGQ